MLRKLSTGLIISAVFFCFCVNVFGEVTPQTMEPKAKELFAAIADGNRKAARLITNGTDLTARDENGMTPFLAAARAGNLSVVRKLMKAGCDVSAQDFNGNNALLLAVNSGSYVLVRFFLAQGFYDINSRNSDGVTPLMIAAEGGGYELVNILLKAKADSRLIDNKGRTLLMHVASSGNLSLLRSLIEQGNADINAVDSVGRPVISYAMANGEAVRYLVEMGANLTRKYIVSEYGDRQFTPLLEAVANNNWQAVRIMLKKGADINQGADYGVTPVLGAALSRQWELFEYLKENGARLDVQLSGIPADKGGHLNGSHPILLAAMDNQEELVCRLMADYGGFANTPSSIGITPLIVAIARDLSDMETCLRTAGVTLSEEQKTQVETMRISESRDAAVRFVRNIKNSLESNHSNERSYPVDAQKYLSDQALDIPDGVRIDYIPACQGTVCSSYRLLVSSETGRVEFSMNGDTPVISRREFGNSQFVEIQMDGNNE